MHSVRIMPTLRWPTELAEKLPDVDDILIANASTGCARPRGLLISTQQRREPGPSVRSRFGLI
jgi:hypothetical protein